MTFFSYQIRLNITTQRENIHEQHFEIYNSLKIVAFHAMRENVNLNGKPSSIKRKKKHESNTPYSQCDDVF